MVAYTCTVALHKRKSVFEARAANFKIPYHPRVNTAFPRRVLRNLKAFGVNARVTYQLGANSFVRNYKRNHVH